MVGKPSASKKVGKRKSDVVDDGESDDDYEQPPAKKPRAPRPRATKKPKDPFANAKELLQSITSAPGSFDVAGSEDEIRTQFITLAEYTKALESSAPSGASGSGSKAAELKTSEEIDELVEKLRRTASSQIKKQMIWRESCRTGNAKWVYEGLCAEPAAFQRLMKLPSAPAWTQTKISIDTLHDILKDRLIAPIRYGSLRITGKDVKVKWNLGTGEFQFAGNYGK